MVSTQTNKEETGLPIEFEREADDSEALKALYDSAPPSCSTRTTQAIRDGVFDVALGARPLVMFSHCHNCGRYWAFSLAEALARYGFVVVSADHAGSLPFSPGAMGEPLSEDQLSVRREDIDFLIEQALDRRLFADTSALEELTIDAQRIGILGHSFGSVTAGLVAQTNERIRAVAGLAAPMANPLFPAVDISKISVPKLFFVAQEDNSIQELGNIILRQNFDDASSPAWRLEMADAGHWSVSDICGLVEAFMAGCGSEYGIQLSRKGSLSSIAQTRKASRWQRIMSRHFLAPISMTGMMPCPSSVNLCMSQMSPLNSKRS